MKKRISSLLVFALVITLLAPAFAFAADEKLTAEEMAQQLSHIFEGDQNGNLNLDQPMDRASFAKVIALLMNLEVTAPAADATPAFGDVEGNWAYKAGFIDAVVKAEYMQGTGTGFNPLGTVSYAEVATVLARLLGVASTEPATPWYANNLAAVQALGFLTDLEDATAEAPRSVLVEAAYIANTALNPVAPELALSVVGAKKLQVTFNKAVDPTKVTFAVKKGSVVVNTDGFEFAEDNKSAVITTTTNLTAGEYVVTVTGVADEAITLSVVAENAKVAKINVTSDKAPRKAGDNTVALVSYEVLNQYGERFANQTVNWTVSTGDTVTTTAAAGAFEIDSAGDLDFIPGAIVYITGVHTASGTVVNAQVEIALASQVNEVVFKGASRNGKLVDLPAGFGAGYVLLFEVKDQYGNVMSNPNHADLVFTSNNPMFVSSNTAAPDNAFATATDVEIGGVNYEAVTLVPGSDPAKGGSVTIQAISKLTGKISKWETSAKALAVVKTFSMATPSDLVAEGETVEIPFTAADQYGEAVTDFDSLDGFIQLNGGAGTLEFEKQNDGSAKLYFTAPATGASSLTDLPVYITSLVTDGGNFSSLMLTVKDAAVPTTVIGLSSSKATTIAEKTSITFLGGDVLVQDQYGRTMAKADVNAWLNGTNSIVLTTDDAATSAFEVEVNGGGDAEVVVIADADDVVTITATQNTASTESLVFALSNANDGSNPIATSAKTVKFTKVPLTSFVSYEVADLGTMYNDGDAATKTDAKYDKTVTVYGVLADGKKVELSTDDYTVSVNAGDALDVTGSVISDVYTTGFVTASDFKDGKEVKLNVLVTVNDANGAAAAILEKELVLSNATPKAAAVTLKSSLVKDGKSIVNPLLADDSISTAKLVAVIDKVKDQYGVDRTEAPTITITNLVKVAGSELTVKDNGKSTANIEKASMGDKFTVTFKYASGVSVQVEFTVGLAK